MKNKKLYKIESIYRSEGNPSVMIPTVNDNVGNRYGGAIKKAIQITTDEKPIQIGIDPEISKTVKKNTLRKKIKGKIKSKRGKKKDCGCDA